MKIGIISLFPEMFDALKCGITGRAIQSSLISMNIWNPRDYTTDKYHTVDDRPYGGGPGMLMKVEPLEKAIHAAKKALPANTKTIYLSPQGKSFNQTLAKQSAMEASLIFVAGRYEGIDERIIQTEIDEEWSIGDYVLSGGELAIMVILDAIIRLLPGALGDEFSAEQDSFMQGLLDCPHYTRPEKINDLAVPPVLLSGNHAEINGWRQKQSLGQTWIKRPDLLEKLTLSDKERKLLQEFINEHPETDYNTRS